MNWIFSIIYPWICHSLSTLSWYLDQKEGSWFWASEFIKHGIWCWVCCLVSCILCPRFPSMELLGIEKSFPKFSMLYLKIVFAYCCALYWTFWFRTLHNFINEKGQTHFWWNKLENKSTRKLNANLF